jgi:hypothetical protein
MIEKYRKKPVMIEALQWDGMNYDEISKFVGSNILHNSKKETIEIHTLEGNMTASKGDYIIRGVDGEFYPCKPDVFKKTYEKATSEPSSGSELTEEQKAAVANLFNILFDALFSSFAAKESLRQMFAQNKNDKIVLLRDALDDDLSVLGMRVLLDEKEGK